VLGVLAVAGLLRAEGLPEPSLVAGLAHDDVLMIGIAVLFTNIAMIVVAGGLLACAASDAVRQFVLAAAHRRPGTSRLVPLAVVGVILAAAFLGAVWWQQAVALIAIVVVLAALWRRGAAHAPAAFAFAAFLAILTLGITGAVLDPPPPARIAIDVAPASTLGAATVPAAGTDSAPPQRVEGAFIGVGQRGEWYIVDDETVRVVPERLVLEAQLSEPPDAAPRLVWQRILNKG
jgi:hypothetical protein